MLEARKAELLVLELPNLILYVLELPVVNDPPGIGHSLEERKRPRLVLRHA
ncbi:MAG: hypothetical protein NTW87_14070 [Planctomycetota bacterium]|nr:hypothetical protein [Planctomycetota bacterium]